MPAVSEEELDQLRKDNEKLREQLASAGSKEAENAAAREREYAALQLTAENTRLEAEVHAAKERAKVTNSRAGATSVLEAAQAQLEAAVAQGEAMPGVPVDTNAEDQPKNTTGATVAVDLDKLAAQEDKAREKAQVEQAAAAEGAQEAAAKPGPNNPQSGTPTTPTLSTNGGNS